jgi:polysaccharide biosynthesis protein PslH
MLESDGATAGPRPRALLVSADLPWPPDGGGRIATLRNLRGIARLYETDLLCLADPIGDPDLSELERLCRRVIVIRKPFTFGRHRLRQGAEALRSLFSIDPYRLRKFRSAELARALAQLRTETRYEIVHFDQFGVAPYWVPDVPTSYSCQNMESDIYRLAAANSRNPVTRLWAWQEGAKLRRAERRILPRFDVIIGLAEEDGRLLRSLGARSVKVVPMPAPASRLVSGPPRQPVLLSLGTMSWFGVQDGLLWFHREVLPLVRELVPDVRWEIVGPHAGARIRQLDGRDGIAVRGYVDDLAPFIESARAAIVPLQIAGGIRMKLLDLMAAGVPSVATSVGARGLGFQDGGGGFRRDDPRGFADALVALLTDDGLWMQTVLQGQRYVAEHHTEGRFMEALEDAVTCAIGNHAEKARA